MPSISGVFLGHFSLVFGYANAEVLVFGEEKLMGRSRRWLQGVYIVSPQFSQERRHVLGDDSLVVTNFA